jgi:phosphinothricin acetyltransferase
MTITALLPEHWSAVKAIYEDGLATGQASFQTNAPSWEEWDASHLKHSRLVALDSQTVAGWAALTPVSGPEGAGFRRLGIRQRIGKMGDRWRDTALLEKRSETVGL